MISKIHDFNDLDRRVNTKIRDISSLFHPSLKELNLYFNIMNVKLCLLNQEMCWNLNNMKSSILQLNQPKTNDTKNGRIEGISYWFTV